MNRSTRSWERVVAGVGLSLLALDGAAAAADLPLKAPAFKAVYDWTGFYLGGHFGYGGGSFGPGTNPLPEQGVVFPHSITGLIGGYQAGYNRQFPSRVVLGIEADASFTSPQDAPAVMPAPFHTTLDYVSTLRGRVGYAFGTLMPYLTGGFAWGHSRVELNDSAGNVVSSPGQTQAGWTAGAGVEFAVSGNWSAKVEYDYIGLSRRMYDLSDFGLPGINVDPSIHLAKLGLNYRFGDTPWTAPVSANAQTALPESDVWNIHAQTTFLPSVYPAFRSPYAGTDSLPGGGQSRETWTATAFLGVRLWQGAEFYFDPELAQGFGLNGTLGLAGFPNGEAQKAGAPYFKIRPQRYYLKQTFGLGGEQEDVPDGANQLPGKRDIDRITLIVGRFAVGDFFDGNTYAKDPRADFMNWAMWSSAAYDFPADLPGYTRGGVVELNRKDWAVRAGLFEVPSAPNSDVLTLGDKNFGTVAELEERYAPFDQPGKLRLGIFANRGFTGNYNQALAIEDANPLLDINAVMASIRTANFKYGFYVNMEQQLMKDVGLFARASWNDGQNEILSFTDIDRSLSGGLSIKGSSWGRPSDTIGIGGAINGLSAGHRDFLAAGGLGLLIGDGRLNYRPEQILETYYAYAINNSFTFTADYQLITNPAYNADRGPVSIFSGRLHGEF
ncbi:carbohydrate porin [Bradyrhizobium erythrophlei]|uniref:High affinity Mn2+ porin n=1 Tax=Bradyrhizobium erythrophlei TaxID=1437360 RepID=A0A1M5Y9N9_9BRAD|nr:carbohydrate porin [Bradyrhizobium erythrophlei]SHI08757.1 high affinity Mn2+ porin [Bradyrhizobium erythrophlei]